MTSSGSDDGQDVHKRASNREGGSDYEAGDGRPETGRQNLRRVAVCTDDCFFFSSNNFLFLKREVDISSPAKTRVQCLPFLALPC